LVFSLSLSFYQQATLQLIYGNVSKVLSAELFKLHGKKSIVKVNIFSIGKKKRLFSTSNILAPRRTMEVMREGAPQSNRALTRGAVRVIVSDRTGRVLYTPILEPE
jgi:hypothetical protein